MEQDIKKTMEVLKEHLAILHDYGIENKLNDKERNAIVAIDHAISVLQRVGDVEGMLNVMFWEGKKTWDLGVHRTLTEQQHNRINATAISSWLTGGKDETENNNNL